MYRLQQSFRITPTLIRSYVYCPVIPWIITHYNIVEPPTYSMIEAGMEDKEYDKIIQEICRGEECVKYREKPVWDHDGLIGVIDLLVEKNRERIIIELKKYKRKRYEDQVAQLKTYAEISSRYSGFIVHRIILVQEDEIVYDKVYELEDKEEVEELINRVREVIESDKPPNTELTSKCNSCWYKRYCPVFLEYS